MTSIEQEFINLDASFVYLENEIKKRYESDIIDNYNNGLLTYDIGDSNYKIFNTNINQYISDINNRLEIQKASINTLVTNINKQHLEDMDGSNNYIKQRISYYEDRKKHLKDLIDKYNNIEGRLVDTKSNRYYILFLIWSIIFIIILITVFTNIIESDTSMNLLSRMVLFIFIIYLGYIIIKNIMLYMNGYSILK
jgi:hypothetical protein